MSDFCGLLSLCGKKKKNNTIGIEENNYNNNNNSNNNNNNTNFFAPYIQNLQSGVNKIQNNTSNATSVASPNKLNNPYLNTNGQYVQGTYTSSINSASPTPSYYSNKPPSAISTTNNSPNYNYQNKPKPLTPNKPQNNSSNPYINGQYINSVMSSSKPSTKPNTPSPLQMLLQGEKIDYTPPTPLLLNNSPIMDHGSYVQCSLPGYPSQAYSNQPQANQAYLNQNYSNQGYSSASMILPNSASSSPINVPTSYSTPSSPVINNPPSSISMAFPMDYSTNNSNMPLPTSMPQPYNDSNIPLPTSMPQPIDNKPTTPPISLPLPARSPPATVSSLNNREFIAPSSANSSKKNYNIKR